MSHRRAAEIIIGLCCFFRTKIFHISSLKGIGVFILEKGNQKKKKTLFTHTYK